MNKTAETGVRLKKFYAGHSIYIDMLAKFVLALASFLWIRAEMNFNPFLSNLFVMLVLAILSTVMPVVAVPIFDAVLIVGQSFGVGIDAGAVSVVIYLVLLILFLRFVPDEAWEAAAMPVLMAIGIPLFLPLVCGVKRKATSVFGIGCGITIYHFVKALADGAEQLNGLETSEYAERLDIIVGGTFGSAFILHLTGCAAALLVVYAIRNLSVKHAFVLSVILGAAVYIVLQAIGAAVLGSGENAAVSVIGTLISLALAVLFVFTDTPLDYGKCEELRFEDDDYYYYVKAVPKLSSVPAAGEPADEDGEGAEEAEKPDLAHVDFEQKLEDSLKNL